MRYLTLLFLLLSTCAWAQENGVRKSPRAIIDAPASQDRFIVALHNDLFLDAPEEMEIRPWSPGFNAYVMYDYPIAKSGISFAWGYGFSSFNIHSNGEFERQNPDGGFVRFFRFPSNYRWDKNKFSANYVEIPLEFRFRTRGSSPFKISAGGKVGYLVNIHTKTIDDNGKRKFYQLPEINRWRYGVVGRIGVGRWSAFAFYSLSPFLNQDKGIPLTAFSAGISIALL